MTLRLRRKIEKIFFAGLLVTVPTMLTFFLLKFLVQYIDKVSTPIVRRFFHTSIPVLGFFITVLIVLAIGVIGTNFLGKQLLSIGGQLLSKIPLVRSIYSSTKQIIETAMSATEKPFQKVVLVPYPRKGVYAIGLVTREVSPDLTPNALIPISQTEDEKQGDQIISVFIPSTPNFTSGLLVMFPSRDIIPLSMTIEEGFKYLMTGGILTPGKESKGEGLEEWELFLF